MTTPLVGKVAYNVIERRKAERAARGKVDGIVPRMSIGGGKWRHQDLEWSEGPSWPVSGLRMCVVGVRPWGTPHRPRAVLAKDAKERERIAWGHLVLLRYDPPLYRGRYDRRYCNGNIMLDGLLGAEVEILPAGTDVTAAMAVMTERCRGRGC
jgi:hypothetical protein